MFKTVGYLSTATLSLASTLGMPNSSHPTRSPDISYILGIPALTCWRHMGEKELLPGQSNSLSLYCFLLLELQGLIALQS